MNLKQMYLTNFKNIIKVKLIIFIILFIPILSFANSVPVLNPIGNKTVEDEQHIDFYIYATDPDNDPITLTADIPVEVENNGAYFIDTHGGSGLFSWVPRSMVGSYTITFTASDGVLSDSESTLIEVTPIPNRAPVITDIADVTVKEDKYVSISVNVNDPDDNPVTITAIIPPELISNGASFQTNFSEQAGMFLWQPTIGMAGTYTVKFIASDGELQDEETVNITVTPDYPPKITYGGPWRDTFGSWKKLTNNPHFGKNDGLIYWTHEDQDTGISWSKTYWKYKNISTEEEKELSITFVSFWGADWGFIKFPSSTLPEGKYELIYHIQDYAGNYIDNSSSPFKVNIDKTEPFIYGHFYNEWEPVANKTLTKDTTIYWAPSDNLSGIDSKYTACAYIDPQGVRHNLAIGSIRIWITMPKVVFPASSLPAGIYTLEITAQDKVGNSSVFQIPIYCRTSITPSIDPVISPTNKTLYTLTGTKYADTSILIDGEEVIPINHETSWSYDLTLKEGQNIISITSKDTTGFESDPVKVIIYLDTSAPTKPQVVYDSETTLSKTQLHATWSSTDPETGIAKYQYSIGTQPEVANVVNWTQVGLQTEITKTGLNLIPGQKYYFNVKAKNNAGTWSQIGVGDGITVNTSLLVEDIKPAQHSSFDEKDIVDISATATDPEQGSLEYQMSVDNNVKQPWSASSTYKWQPQQGEHGYHNIKVEVKDNNSGYYNKEVEIYVFREPISPTE